MYRFVGSQRFFFVTEWVVCLAPAKHACLYVHAYERTGVQPHVYSWVSVFFSHSKVDLDVKIRWSRCKSHFAHCQMLHRVLRTRYQVVPRCVFPCGQAATLLSRFFVTCSTVYAGLVLTLCDCVVELVMQFHYRGEVPQFVP